MTLNKEILDSGKFPDLVKGLSFEYLLAYISREVLKSGHYSDIVDFNKKNTFSLTKILTYPFFVALANGNSESLYKLFSPFYSFTNGPLSFGILQYLDFKAEGHDSKLKYFDIISEHNPIGIAVKNNMEIDEVINRIKKHEILFDSGSIFRFEELNVINNNNLENKLTLAIESGVNAIQIQSRNSFFEADLEIIKLHSSYFHVLNKRFKKDEVLKIEYSDLEKENKRPFYSIAN